MVAVGTILTKDLASDFVKSTVVLWETQAQGQNSKVTNVSSHASRDGWEPSNPAMHRVKRVRSDNGGEYVSVSSGEWMQKTWNRS